jgi:5-methylthioadenosine/S-adenosylhomocysteine deaminase
MMLKGGNEGRVTPGFIDAHSHLRSTSYHEHGVRGVNLEESLLRMTAMTAVDIADDVFVACSELIAQGVTGVQMMFHTFGDPDDYRQTLDHTVKGIRRSGIRALVVLGTTDSAEFVPPGLDPEGLIPDFSLPARRLTQVEFGDVVERAVADYPDVSFGVGPVGPQWCTDPLLNTIAEISQQGFRVHTHFAESEVQRHWAGDLLVRMRAARLLGPKTSLAHAVWLQDSEMDELRDLGVSLVTCPLSNHLLRAGLADVEAWQRRGIPFGVGLDSADRDATPMAVATRAVSRDDAVLALTLGGQSASGLDTTADRVEWSSDTLETPLSVSINGHHVVVDGQLTTGEDVNRAREKISERMLADEASRETRHQILHGHMPTYLRAIAEVMHER